MAIKPQEGEQSGEAPVVAAEKPKKGAKAPVAHDPTIRAARPEADPTNSVSVRLNAADNRVRQGILPRVKMFSLAEHGVNYKKVAAQFAERHNGELGE